MTQHNSPLDSADKQKIVVLDDDRLSSHNLSIQLRFVGETPLLSASDNWKQLFTQLSESRDLDNIFAIALGVIKSFPLIDLLNTLHSHFPNLPLLLLNNQEEIQYSQLPESLQAKFLPLGDKSLNYRSLLVALQNARQLSGRAPNVLPSNIISESGTAMFRSLSGQSESMQRVRQLVQGIATRQVTALVIGESGTGKEIVARNLHYHSGRSEQPFIVVNCSAVAAERQGVELFGQEKNFHGAATSIPGFIEKAHGGTLFFDDVAELPLNVQGMLLRFLEDKKFQRMGGHATITSDVRVVAATHYNLEERIRQGTFRQDLYYRLSVVPIAIPPLRSRAEDIPDLIKELLSRLENKEHSSIRFNTACLQSLQRHSWPGNVRELANLVERMCIIKPNEVIGLHDLPQEYQYTDDDRRQRVAEPAFQSSGIDDQAAQGPRAGAAIPASADKSQPEVDRQTADPAAQQAAAAATGEKSQPEPETTGTRKKSAPQQDAVTAASKTQGGAATPEAASAGNQATAASSTQSSKQVAENLAMVPLNAELLERYLENFERNLLEVAMLDSANIMKFAADRLKLDENVLRQKLQKYGMA